MSTVQSTPHSQRAGTSSADFTHASLDNDLARETKEHTFSSVSVVAFLEHVLDFSTEAIEFWRPIVEQWKQMEDFQSALGTYKQKMDTGNETDLYGPFSKLANLITHKADEMDGDKRGEALKIEYQALGNVHLKSRRGVRKPDVITVPVDTNVKSDNIWSKVLAVWEFKKVVKAGGKRRGEELSEEEDRSSESKRAKMIKDARSQNSSRARTKETTSSSLRNESANVSLTSQNSHKKPLGKKNASVQLAGYIAEMFTPDTFREWTFGVLVESERMKLQYYDRTCSVESISFDYINENLTDFILLIVAIQKCDYHRIGYSQLFHYKDLQNSAMLQQSNIEPPHPIEQIQDDTLPRMKWGNDIRIQLQESINDGTYGIFGRSTIVHRVKIGRFVDGLWVDESGGEHFVLKASWQVKTRMKEEEIVSKARSINSKHTPAMFLAFSYERTLPSEKLMEFCENKSESWEYRCLRFIVFREYIPLFELDGEDFRKAFNEIVNCHHDIHELGLILHRDLSILNLMYWINHNNEKVGILNDYDLSIILNRDKTLPAPSSKHRTGTAPFMARELLDLQTSTPHLYRHDLESFLYILIWIAIGYKGFKHPKGQLEPLRGWRKNDWKDIAEKKESFMASLKVFDNLESQFLEGYGNMRDVIHDLYDVFAEAYHSAEKTKQDFAKEINLKFGIEKVGIYHREDVIKAGQDVLAASITWDKVKHLFPL